MKKNLLRTSIVSVMLTSSLLCQAQISLFKFENGKKTPLTGNEKFDIVVDKDEHVQTSPNYVVEVDLAAFKKKYNYDHFRIRLNNLATGYSYGYPVGKSFESAYEYIKFADPVFIKKYAGAKLLSFYLFKTDETNTPNSFSLIKLNTFANYVDMSKGFQLIVEGGYIKGDEEYYDKSSQSWKRRDVFSDWESITSLADVKIKMSDEWQLNDTYKKLVNPGEMRYVDESGTLLRGVNAMTITLSRQAKSMASYKQIPVAIAIVSDYMQKNISGESDHKKAISLVADWNKKALPLCADKLLPADLKALNKELKSTTDAEAILEIFKKYNPSSKWPD